METCKILYVITKSNQGGAQKYVLELATRLPHPFIPIVALGGDGWLQKELQKNDIQTIPLKELKRDIGFLQEFRAFKELYKIVKAEKPYVLHVNSSKAGALGTLVGRLLRVPNIIYTSHGWAFNEERNYVQKFVFKIIAKLTILLSHTTILVSNAVRKQIAKLNGCKKKLVVIYNGFPMIQMLEKKHAQDLLKQISDSLNSVCEKNNTWIGTISELHKNKGVDIAIEAMYILVKKYPQLRFLVLGEGEERSTLEKQINKLELKNNVFLLGHVENAAQYLKALGIFVLASRTEALGTVLIEAGHAKVPVVVTNVGGTQEIVDDMKSGLIVRPRQPKEIANAIEYLLTNPSQQTKFADSLSKKVQETFQVDTMIKKTVAIYEQSN